MPLREFELSSNDAQYDNLVHFIGESNGQLTYLTGYLTYLHTTDKVETCESICRNGFVFEIFEKTTDYVHDIASLRYMLSIRRHYGDYTIVIQISKEITDYESISRKTIDDNGSELFILPPHYIKGYYNRISSGIVHNPLFRK